MKNFINKKNIFWDFDGVILDSMSVRDKGFELVLQEFPKDEVDRLMIFHRENGGLSRYVKFRYFFEEIRGESISEEMVNEYAGKFSEVMLKNLLDPSLIISDSQVFIRSNFKKYEMHIVSGSDQNELIKICEKLHLAEFFRSINGSPTPKIELVRNLLEKFHYSAEESMLVGDSKNDFEAAQENGVSFCGYNNMDLQEMGLEYIETFQTI